VDENPEEKMMQEIVGLGQIIWPSMQYIFQGQRVQFWTKIE
jgi:hypothetical protein